VPRGFAGILPKYGYNIDMTFLNPKPFFSIYDWFFGASVEFVYTSTGSSPESKIKIMHNS
jgi:hypothetical protein